MRKVCEANLAGSFEKASRLLESLAGLSIGVKRVQLISEGVGRVLVEERDEATKVFFAHPPRPSRSAPAVALMVITADGGRVQTRQDDPAQKWKEDKVAVVYPATPSPQRPGVEYQGPSPGPRSVVATMESWEALGNHASTLADRRGYARAVQKVFISDAATGVRSVRETCFPDARFVLDWAHAVEHLHVCAVAAFGPGPKEADWLERQKERLWNGQLPAVISEIARLSRRLGPPPKSASENDPRKIVASNLEYFRSNRQAMDYPLFRKQGWPLGSGIVESTIKQVGKRMKGTEKHWTIRGAEQTLQVITHLISQDGAWADFWRRCPLAA